MTPQKGDRVRITFPAEYWYDKLGTIQAVPTSCYAFYDIKTDSGDRVTLHADEFELLTVQGRESLTGSEALLLRESTAPNANRILHLEARVSDLQADRTRLEKKVEALEAKVDAELRRPS